jgi:hypothetical protein
MVVLNHEGASVKSDLALISPVGRYLARLAEQKAKAEKAHGVAGALSSAKAERLAGETGQRFETRIADIEARVERDFVALDEATTALKEVREIQTRATAMANGRVAQLRAPAPAFSL